MSLKKWQIDEIAAFDWKKRTGGDFDGRRYGSVTGGKAPYHTETWRPCRGSDVYLGAKRPPRKTLRYNYIELESPPERTLAEVVKGVPPPKPLRDREVVVVHVAVRLDGTYRQVVKEVGRWHIKTGHLELRDIDYHGLGGWIVEWQKEDWAGGKAAKASGDSGPRLGKPVCGWYDGGKWKYNTGLTFPWHETINLDALKGTKYEWCQYSDDTPCKAGLVDWLMMYRAEPKIELLAKMGLHRLVCPGGIRALKDKRVRDWLIAHREEAAQRYRDGSPRYDMSEILYAARHGRTIKDALKRRRFIEDVLRRMDRWRPGCDFKRRARIDYDRLMKTLQKWHVGVDEYVRYIEYAHEMGLDLRNEGTMYPPVRGGRVAFMARLERLEADVARKRRREARAERAEERRRMAAFRAQEAERRVRERAEKKWIDATMKTRLAELEAFQKSMKRTDILKGSGYTLVVAKTQKELLAEGRKMGNCVGRGTYGQAIVKGESLIVMLRLDGESFCDIEIDRKRWVVRQCYLQHNKPAPKAVREIAKRLAAWFKAEHLRHMKRKMFKALGRKSA